MKQTLKNAALIAGVLITISGTAYGQQGGNRECESSNDCAVEEVCFSWIPADPTFSTECVPKDEPSRRFGGGIVNNRNSKPSNPLARLFNAIADIIRPIAPPTIAPIARTAALIAAPNPTRAYNTLPVLMQRIEAQRRAAATTPETLIDENGEEYTCVPEGSGRLDCAEPKEETQKEDLNGNKYWVCEEPKKSDEKPRTGGNICHMSPGCRYVWERVPNGRGGMVDRQRLECDDSEEKRKLEECLARPNT